MMSRVYSWILVTLVSVQIQQALNLLTKSKRFRTELVPQLHHLQTPEDVDMTHYLYTQVNLTSFSLTAPDVESTTRHLQAAVCSDALQLTMQMALKHVPAAPSACSAHTSCERHLNSSVFHGIFHVSRSRAQRNGKGRVLSFGEGFTMQRSLIGCMKSSDLRQKTEAAVKCYQCQYVFN